MSTNDARPDIGACSGIPDIGAWQFVIPDGLRNGTLQSRPMATGSVTSTTVANGTVGSRAVVEGKFGADQS